MGTSVTFPSWATASVLEQVQRFRTAIDQSGLQSANDLLDRILGDARMLKIWDFLGRMDRKSKVLILRPRDSLRDSYANAGSPPPPVVIREDAMMSLLRDMFSLAISPAATALRSRSEIEAEIRQELSRLEQLHGNFRELYAQSAHPDEQEAIATLILKKAERIAAMTPTAHMSVKSLAITTP
jgi:hypothetical protein